MKNIINELKNYFDVTELVCPHVYNRFKDSSWYFFDKDLLEVLLWLRKTIDKPITVNNWKNGGQFSQRGIRCNCCQLVKSKSQTYMSAHILGKGVDLDVKGMTAEQTRQWIKEHKDELPHNIRLEKGVNWVHLDVRNYTDEKIEMF